MKTQSDLLEEAVVEMVTPEFVLCTAPGGISKDEVAIWTIEEHTWVFDGKSKKVRSIILHYVTWSGKEWITDEGISEGEGPALLNCPISFLQYPVDPETIFEEWRYEVKKFHESVGPAVQDDKVSLRLIKALEKGT